eukprot:TRINITY_DN827_c0_g1_i2.p1 TRINITY_DN827_c0_g1~~TRINITY_DN827_c0_g1_i2.p1  ORF type:complete len:532 (+),score=26.27 TRINITY_DN827_c0_g1_i2:80-1675(+)
MRTGASLACVAVVVAALLLVPGTEGKGSAGGSRAIYGRATGRGTPRAWLYGMWFARPYYVSGHAYSPGYGSFERSPGWTATNETDGYCGNGTCPCPVPQENKTKTWVWVQIQTNNSLCALCAGGLDATTFEVDAFISIASQVPCRPPTQLLVLKLCKLKTEKEIRGGLADDQLKDSKKCITVGDEASQHGAHFQARMRRLLQTSTEYNVAQFVVGAENEAHANFLHAAIKRSMNVSSRFGAMYNLSSKPIRSIETQTPDPKPPLWFIILSICVPLSFCLTAAVATARACSRTCRQKWNALTASTVIPGRAPSSVMPFVDGPYATMPGEAVDSVQGDSPPTPVAMGKVSPAPLVNPYSAVVTGVPLDASRRADGSSPGMPRRLSKLSFGSQSRLDPVQDSPPVERRPGGGPGGPRGRYAAFAAGRRARSGTELGPAVNVSLSFSGQHPRMQRANTPPTGRLQLHRHDTPPQLPRQLTPPQRRIATPPGQPLHSLGPASAALAALAPPPPVTVPAQGGNPLGAGDRLSRSFGV